MEQNFTKELANSTVEPVKIVVSMSLKSGTQSEKYKVSSGRKTLQS